MRLVQRRSQRERAYHTTEMRSPWTPFGRRQRNASLCYRETIRTLASAITIFRALACSALIVDAVVARSESIALLAFGVNMLLDSIDGEVARRRRRETTLGAQLDGAVDRFIVILVVLAIAGMRSDQLSTMMQGLAVCGQFAVVDQIMSMQFLRFRLWSPDHFYVIDEWAWRINWSPIAKIAGNVPVLLFLASPTVAWGGLAIATVLSGMRTYSYWRIRRLARRLPELNYAVGSAAPSFEEGLAGVAEDEPVLGVGCLVDNTMQATYASQAGEPVLL